VRRTKTVLAGFTGLVLAAMLGGCAWLEPRQTAHRGTDYRREDAALTRPSAIGGTVDGGGGVAGGHT
jgi:hypothetical protein